MKTKIKILFINARTLYPNPFITTLAGEIASDLYQVHKGTDEFWQMRNHYDIIHINWSEIFFQWRMPTEQELELLDNALQKWKQRGAKIVYTRHDEKFHYCATETGIKLIDLIETESDAVAHLGNYSKNQLIHKKNANQIHQVIPHHIYDTIYTNNISKEEARTVLNIPFDKMIILVFGHFRNEEEYLLVKNAYEDLEIADKYLLVPSWNYSNNYSMKNCYLGRGAVNENMLPYCFAACDIVFIQRLRLLNSGNLPMAFLFNKTVVGPAIGNIGESLDNINNFSFDPFDRQSVNKAMGKAVERISANEQTNEEYAKKNWSTANVAEEYKKLYDYLVNCYMLSYQLNGIV